MGERTANLSSIVDARRANSTRYKAIATALAALRRGELVAMPTETVYGLAADACNARAVGKIFIAKGRPRFNPLILHVASRRPGAARLGIFGGEAEKLAEAFWPGPLTLVLPMRPASWSATLPPPDCRPSPSACPAHPVAKALLVAFGGPLAAPSANRSGHVSPTTAAHVAADIGVAVSVDPRRRPDRRSASNSTIVGLAGDEPTLLRSGAIPRAMIETVLGRPLATPTADPEAPEAPGMMKSHYAPAAKLRLNVTSVEPGEALLAFGATLPEGADKAVATINLSESEDLTEAAAKFFAALRELDQQAEAIAVDADPRGRAGRGDQRSPAPCAAPR